VFWQPDQQCVRGHCFPHFPVRVRVHFDSIVFDQCHHHVRVDHAKLDQPLRHGHSNAESPCADQFCRRGCQVVIWPRPRHAPEADFPSRGQPSFVVVDACCWQHFPCSTHHFVLLCFCDVVVGCPLCGGVLFLICNCKCLFCLARAAAVMHPASHVWAPACAICMHMCMRTTGTVCTCQILYNSI
jgi:hypothetical protein